MMNEKTKEFFFKVQQHLTNASHPLRATPPSDLKAMLIQPCGMHHTRCKNWIIGKNYYFFIDDETFLITTCLLHLVAYYQQDPVWHRAVGLHLTFWPTIRYFLEGSISRPHDTLVIPPTCNLSHILLCPPCMVENWFHIGILRSHPPHVVEIM